MRTALHRLRQALNRTPSPATSQSHRASVSASIGLVAVPIVMASSYYSTAVTKPQLGPDAVPEDAEARPHHVLKRNGKTSHFRNIHPSAGHLFAAWPMWKAITSYVSLWVPLSADWC